ncbi:TetR/AcrR family transcriptional regulator [Vagococcus elongatus]|uniref:HTH tetR-type domain-containing protein n=1 Tax=Vagococcus elongatus TaxID=180344 RepID=A0A430AY75_9ENTE|nr:TetR/AcrR family transcriptional regulator [Vagococcus elongatus]RSU13013.1 hypothetical protein CBF29_04910 [Vagococcus elongatus]
MPTETFFRLPEEKKARILAAAKEEFSVHSIREASISNIIKLADIPRGSFYQYFDGMEDLYLYFFDFLRRNSMETFSHLLDETKGDLFESYSQYFEILIHEVMEGEYVGYFRQLFLNMDNHVVRHVSKGFNVRTHRYPKGMEQFSVKQKGPGRITLKDLDTTNLRIKSDEELKELVHLILHILFSTIVQAYRKEKLPPKQRVDEAIMEFDRKLDWLKNGVEINGEVD